MKRLGVLAALVLVLLGGTAAAGPGNGPILFLMQPELSSRVDPTPDLFSVRADGSGLVRLTSSFHPVNPVLSPDGAKIAFLLTDGGSPRDLYVMNSDGNAPRQLRSYPEYENSGGLRDLTWSPDSRLLAYLLPQSVIGEQLRIVDVARGAEVPVPPDALVKSQLAWSPDGTELAFAALGQSATTGIYAKSVATGAVRTIVPTAGASSPKWSPDGRELAYIAGSAWVVPRAGGAAREVGRPILMPPYSAAPLWSPDGRTIYFSQAVYVGAPFFRGSPTVRTALFAANADGSGQRQLRGDARAIGWSPEGDALVVGLRGGVYFTRPDGKCLTYVTPGTFVGWLPGGNPPPPDFECVDLVARESAPTLAGRVGASVVVTVDNDGTRSTAGVVQQIFSGTSVVVLAYDKEACRTSSPRGGQVELFCNLGTLPPNSQRELHFVVRGEAGIVASGTSAKASTRDSDPTSNVANAYVRMSRCWLLGREVQGDTLHGTARSELICGLSGDDRLFGAGGDDTLDGGYGADVLVGGPAHDTFLGGFGDDRVYARDGARDQIDCGRGADVVTADRFDVIARNCEVDT